MNLFEAFEVHDTLNPKIWTSNNKLLPEVKDKILKIVETFKEFIEIPIWISDIHLVGSNASYNYHEGSDLDVHIIANYELVNVPEEILSIIYNTQRVKFKNTYPISIHGVDIELYVEDVNTSPVTNGIYSVFEERWIKFPKKLTDIPRPDIDTEVNLWTDLANNAIKSKDIDTIVSTISNIYMLRKNSLATDGEYGRGNLIFKALRDREIIQKLKDTKDELITSDLSLESLSNNNNLKESLLTEDSVARLLGKSKSSVEGSKRFSKRVKSHIRHTPAQYNQIDMNKLFTDGILTVDLEVQGESDTYYVRISYGGFLDILHDQIKRAPEGTEVDLKMITKTLILGFNRGDVYVHCTCDDFAHRFAYYATVNNTNSGAPESRRSDETNPNDDLGSGCKHVLLALTNTSWILKCATVVYNYILYIKMHEKNLYQKILYPAIYGKPFEEKKEEPEDAPEGENPENK